MATKSHLSDAFRGLAVSIVSTVCSRFRYALADKRRVTRSDVSQKNTLPFKSRYHSEGVIP